MSTVATHVMFNLIEIGETRVTSGNKRDATINQTPILLISDLLGADNELLNVVKDKLFPHSLVLQTFNFIYFRCSIYRGYQINQHNDRTIQAIHARGFRFQNVLLYSYFY